MELYQISQVPKQNRLKPSKYKGLSLSVCMAYWGLFLREKIFFEYSNIVVVVGFPVGIYTYH